MATNNSDPEVGGSLDAPRLLAELQSDRARLAERMRPPRWFAPGFGLVTAACVSTPALPYDGTGNVVLTAALVASIALIAGYQRVTGIRVSRFGVREWALFAVSVLVSLVLLSISFGLAAAELHLWIIAPAAAGFALVTWFVGMLNSSARDRLSDGH